MNGYRLLLFLKYSTFHNIILSMQRVFLFFIIDIILFLRIVITGCVIQNVFSINITCVQSVRKQLVR